MTGGQPRRRSPCRRAATTGYIARCPFDLLARCPQPPPSCSGAIADYSVSCPSQCWPGGGDDGDGRSQWASKVGDDGAVGRLLLRLAPVAVVAAAGRTAKQKTRAAGSVVAAGFAVVVADPLVVAVAAVDAVSLGAANCADCFRSGHGVGAEGDDDDCFDAVQRQQQRQPLQQPGGDGDD